MSGAVQDRGAMEALKRRAARIGEARAERVRAGIAAEAAALPGVRAHVEGEGVVLEGRGLLERWLRDAHFRDVGRNSR